MIKTPLVRCPNCGGHHFVPSDVIVAETKWLCPQCQTITDCKSAKFKAVLARLVKARAEAEANWWTAIRLQGVCSKCGAKAPEGLEKCTVCGATFK